MIDDNDDIKKQKERIINNIKPDPRRADHTWGPAIDTGHVVPKNPSMDEYYSNDTTEE